jgi:S-adenosylmethionine:tRNA ribosyltransferase-isomerase
MSTLAPLDFELPHELEAHVPPEAEGRPRDDVRLLVAEGRELTHRRFRDLPGALAPGDLLVVNTSATVAASLACFHPGHGPLDLHLATRLPGGPWIVELRHPAGTRWHHATAADTVSLAAGLARLVAPFPLDGPVTGSRLWLAHLDLEAPVDEVLRRHGRPVRYGDAPRDVPLEAFQTIFAREPGSAEMPSAARPFSARVLRDLRLRGVALAEILLHTGLSSLEDGEPPHPEPWSVTHETAIQVAAARAAGGRVIAVGTTVVRALETSAARTGEVEAGGGFTELTVEPATGVRAVDGLLTGWHEPRASHLRLLEAVAGRAVVEESYAAALEAGYRWHEFGDLHLVLPGDRTPAG